MKRLCNAVLEALQVSLGIRDAERNVPANVLLKKSGRDILNLWNTISTLDDQIDDALGGGIPTGYITEITGERYDIPIVFFYYLTKCSGAGKTQFLLTLLLSAQLPSPRGISCSVLYISTESVLPTTRLAQLLRTHPILIAADPKPSLDTIISIVTSDLESQDHILRFQVPVAIRRHGIRLIILDSVAANYRAEFERPGIGTGQTSAANMAQRSSELVKLGQLLRDIAREENIAIVVANQVADRFSGSAENSPILHRATQSSPLARRGGGMPTSSLAPLMSSMSTAAELGLVNPTLTSFSATTTDPMSLDHQQRWFTGWGDDPHPSHLTIKSLKTPSLGLIWTTQIACRIALIKRPVYGPGRIADEENERGEPVLTKWRRWMKVVFAPHVGPSGPGLEGAVEFEIKAGGIHSVQEKGADGNGTDTAYGVSVPA